MLLLYNKKRFKMLFLTITFAKYKPRMKLIQSIFMRQLRRRKREHEPNLKLKLVHEMLIPV